MWAYRENQAIPGLKQLSPPGEVLPELLVEPDWVIILVEDAEQINHATKEPQKLP